MYYLKVLIWSCMASSYFIKFAAIEGKEDDGLDWQSWALKLMLDNGFVPPNLIVTHVEFVDRTIYDKLQEVYPQGEIFFENIANLNHLLGEEDEADGN